MMPALDGLAGIVILVIFGSVFLITCGISAIKAIRDRSRLKKRKSRRKNAKEQTERCRENKKKDFEVLASQNPKLETKKCRSSKSCKVSKTDTSFHSKKNVDLSVYSVGEGIDNLSFRHSNSDIVIMNENECSSSDKSLTENKKVPSLQTLDTKNVVSQVNKSDKHNVQKRLPTDCFIIRKITRRHSYEVAICENSWMPEEELPCDSNTKLDTSNIDENKECKKTVNFSFENQAFNKDDFENT